MLNLDTHIVIFALTDELTSRERKILSVDDWSISDIVIWEISMLHRHGRISLHMDSSDMTRMFSRLHVWQISLDIGRAMHKLDFSSDPADEIIAATSIVHRLPLVTRDRKMLKSSVVPLADA